MQTKQPKEMYLLALTEMCQRFSFWGIANILVLYLVQAHQLSDQFADQLFGIFTGVAFILPLAGGYLADRLNYRLPVIWGMISTSIGCFLLATSVVPLLFIALIFLSVGASIFTPSIYALLGSLYHQKHSLRDSGFSIYYAAVNIGVFIGTIVLGAFGQGNHWNVAFLIAGIVQLLGLFPFSKALKNKELLQLATTRFQDKKKKDVSLHPHEKKRIWVIAILSLFSILFWVAYNQGGSSLNLFALRYTDRNIFNFEMPASWLLSSESLYLVLFSLPLAALYQYLAKRKRDPNPQTKSAISLFAIGICFLIMMIGSLQISANATHASVSAFFPLLAYAFMALGEMLIAPIGLSLITHISPRRFTAMLVGVWYLCIGVAFYLGGALAPLMSKVTHLSSFFLLFVIIAVVAGTALMFIVKKLEKMRHLKTL